MRGTQRIARATIGVLAGFVLAGTPGLARASPARLILDVLHMGSREDLGLGGDPFLSPLRGESGWWRQDLLDGPSDARFETDQHWPVTQRLSGGDGRLEGTRTRLGIRHALARRGRRLDLGLRAAHVRSMGAAEGDLASLDFDARATSVDAIVRLEELVPGLRLQTAFPLARSSSLGTDDGVSFGARWSFHDRIVLSRLRRRSWMQEPVVAVLDGETIVSPTNAELDATRHAARVEIGWGLAFELDVRTTDIGERDARRGVDYELTPALWTMDRHQSVEWAWRDRLRLIVRHSDFEIRGESAGYWEGGLYLSARHLKTLVDDRLAGIEVSLDQRRRLLVDFERGEAEGFGRVDLSAWRFTSWQQAWVGAKKIVQLDGTATWDRYHVGYEQRGRAWDLAAGLHWYEIRPDAFTEDWILVILSPRQDYTRTDLDVERLSLGAVSFGARHRWGRFEASAAFHQFVYANDHLESAASTDPPDPSVPASPGRGGWFGGSYAAVSVGITIGQ